MGWSHNASRRKRFVMGVCRWECFRLLSIPMPIQATYSIIRRQRHLREKHWVAEMSEKRLVRSKADRANSWDAMVWRKQRPQKQQDATPDESRSFHSWAFKFSGNFLEEWVHQLYDFIGFDAIHNIVFCSPDVDGYSQVIRNQSSKPETA